MMQQLAGFQFATALDLNMRYYTIRIEAKSKVVTTIVTEFGKSQYNVFPVVMVMYGDISQAKVNKILGYIERIKAYINGIIVLKKVTFVDHVDQLRICFSRIHKEGLKINDNKCSLILEEIPYLGYVIIREGVKLDPKKTQ